MKAFCQYLAILAILFTVCLIGGCATCGTCQGAEPRGKWRAANGEVPPPPFAPPSKSGPHARPLSVAQADEFATPPTDGEDPEEPEAVEPPAPKVKRAKTRLVKETDGGLVIEQHGSGQIFLNSPGAAPAQAPAQAALVQAPAVTSWPLIPGPLPDAQVVGIGKRIAGGLYYAATGKCPKPKAAAAVAPVQAYVQQTSYALVPQTSYAAVPVQTVAPVQVAAPLQYMQLPPLPAAMPAPAAPSPQAPLASPQSAPRKSLFGR